MHEPEPVELFLMGAGVSFPEHLTVQTLDLLSSCRQIYSNLPDVKLDALPKDLRAKSVSLAHLYKDARRRADNYHDVVAAVLAGAEQQRRVAWLTPGHPIVFDSPTSALLKAGRARGWKVVVLPAISSIDTLLAEVEFEPADGLFIHEASAVVRFKIPLMPSMGVMLLQPSLFLSERAHLSLSELPKLELLRDYLLLYYGGDHRCAFVRSASSESGEAQIAWVTISGLAEAPAEVVAGSSLFIPGTKASKPEAA
jgi:uncharacterized protein YabN with tetrapyrrole methylase and pyrophosphatase domain